MTTQPMQDDIMHELKDIKGELGDIKCQLANSKKAFNKALYQTPLAYGATLVVTGLTLKSVPGDWRVFFGVGVAAILYSFWKIRKDRKKEKEVKNIMAAQQTQEPTHSEIITKLDKIESQLKNAARRDIQAAWLAFAVLGAGFVVVGMKDVPLVYPYNLLVVLVGVAMLIGAFCKVKSISKRQK